MVAQSLATAGVGLVWGSFTPSQPALSYLLGAPASPCGRSDLVAQDRFYIVQNCSYIVQDCSYIVQDCSYIVQNCSYIVQDRSYIA